MSPNLPNDPRDSPRTRPDGRIEPVVDWQEVEFERPPASASATAPTPAWRNRRHWRWASAIVVILMLLLVVFRQPLATLIWPDTRVQRLLDDANVALEKGHLSAEDGSGARQRFEAAQALDNDRNEARAGLVRVAEAALARARVQVQEKRFEEARASLALASELQAPRAQVEAVANALRERESAHAGVDGLLMEASAAQAEGKFDIALPLYQRVLMLQPTHTVALEQREDALSDVLQQANRALAKGDLATGARLIAQVRTYDAGHVELPDGEALLARTVEQRRQRADADLRRKRPEQALAGYRAVLEASPDDAAAKQGIDRVATAFAQLAMREAADFDFMRADASLRQAREVAPDASAVKEASQSIARARQSQSRLASALPAGERTRRVQALLAATAAAEARGDWLTPPGESAFDALRAAQALAPEDREVKRAAARFVPATQACFENELRANRLRRAQGCYEAWQTIAPRDAGLDKARRQLASKWIAVGDEQLGSGDVAFAARALQEARALDPETPGLAELAQRVVTAQGGAN